MTYEFSLSSMKFSFTFYFYPFFNLNTNITCIVIKVSDIINYTIMGMSRIFKGVSN